MGAYSSSIGRQLAGFERDLEQFVLKTLNQGGRRIRSRLIRERLSGPPGLNKKTGRMIQSIEYRPIRIGEGWRLNFSIGRTAPYASKHESRIGADGQRRPY